MEGKIFSVVDQIGPWVMICTGIWWLLTTTVLYNWMKTFLEPMMEFSRWMLKKTAIQNERISGIVSEKMIKIAEKQFVWIEQHQGFFRWSTFGLSFAMMIGGVVWLVN